MTEEITRRDFLAQHGFALIDQGYTVVPIQPGKKAPGYDGWQKAKPSKAQIHEWLTNGFKNAGVGIMTRYTCAIDIDCPDEKSALHFERRALKLLGVAPVRIGKAPKRLLLYRTIEPFRKRRSNVYVDEWGDKQLIEVLGDGQQFVAFAIHPDTGKPFTWVDGKSPLNIRATDLTEVDLDQVDVLLNEFNEWGEREGWEIKTDRRNGSPAGKIDKDNPWLEDSAAIEISSEELRTRLLLIDADDYDTWYQVGMALYHQFDGEDEGFDLWNEWSEISDKYDPDALERHWKSFSIDGKKRAPLTARFILRLAKEAVAKTAMELGIKLRDAFINAKDLPEWEKARQAAREAEIDGLARSALAVVAKERRDAITGTKTSLAEIKKAISYQPKKSETLPKWCEGWVYDVSEDRFFNIDRKIAVTKQGFDAMYDRYSLTRKDILDGKTVASQSASDLALNVYRVQCVDGQRYMPGRDSIFTDPDGKFVNTYPEHEIPEKPEKLLPRDKKAIERVKHHIAHLIANDDEQRMLLDWMAWVVQNPGKHVNYAVLLQGVEGDGKTFFAEMLRAVMGISNVSMANGNTVIKSDFTSWAYGQCVACIEEVRLANTKGVDKWEALNKIKPFITNNVIEIHPKGKPQFNVINTTSYMLFSNYKDALPIDENSRRYLVLFSRWQHRDDIMRFKADNPNYYVRLYETLVESAGALRQWLLDHEVDSSFNPLGDAPETTARAIMIRKSKPEFIQVLDDIIEEDRTVAASRDLVNVTELHEVMVALGVEWPGPKALSSMLERDGYEQLGKVRVNGSDIMHRFYTKKPRLFVHDGYGVDTTKIRRFVKERSSLLDDEL